MTGSTVRATSITLTVSMAKNAITATHSLVITNPDKGSVTTTFTAR